MSKMCKKCKYKWPIMLLTISCCLLLLWLRSHYKKPTKIYFKGVYTFQRIAVPRALLEGGGGGGGGGHRWRAQKNERDKNDNGNICISSLLLGFLKRDLNGCSGRLGLNSYID